MSEVLREAVDTILELENKKYPEFVISHELAKEGGKKEVFKTTGYKKDQQGHPWISFFMGETELRDKDTYNEIYTIASRCGLHIESYEPNKVLLKTYQKVWDESLEAVVLEPHTIKINVHTPHIKSFGVVLERFGALYKPKKEHSSKRRVKDADAVIGPNSSGT